MGSLRRVSIRNPRMRLDADVGRKNRYGGTPLPAGLLHCLLSDSVLVLISYEKPATDRLDYQ